MLTFVNRLFALAFGKTSTPAPTSAASNESLVFGAASTSRQDDVEIGQARDASLLFNTELVRMGRDIVGASTEITPELVAHVDAMAIAQGEGWSASRHDPQAFMSDARSVELRLQHDGGLDEAQARVAEARTTVIEARTVLDDVAPVSQSVVLLGYPLAFLAGIAGAVVLDPTVVLLLGPTFRDVVGESYVAWASGVAALALGMTPPFLAMAGATGRAHPAKLALLGGLELLCLAGLAWGRAQLIGGVPAGLGLTADEAAMVSGTGTSRSAMMFAIESLLIVSVTGIGMQVSTVLSRRDRRTHAEERFARAERLLADARAELAVCHTVRRDDLARMTQRDVASERGEKVRKLCRQLIMHGVLEQVQANLDALQGAPRARCGVADLVEA